LPVVAPVVAALATAASNIVVFDSTSTGVDLISFVVDLHANAPNPLSSSFS
jgi:hypothetical protein